MGIRIGEAKIAFCRGMGEEDVLCNIKSIRYTLKCLVFFTEQEARTKSLCAIVSKRLRCNVIR